MQDWIIFSGFTILSFLGWIAFVYLYFEIKDLRNIIKYMKEKDK